MKPQFTNKVLSSALLWLDNKLCTQGQAYFNISGGLFYGTQNLFNGYTTYASQYSNFHFKTVNLYNGKYNPKGKKNPCQPPMVRIYYFPYEKALYLSN